MARFLFTVWPFTGCVNPQVAVAECLASRGHEIAFYTGSQFRSQIEQRGFTFFPYTKLDEKHLNDLFWSDNAMGNNWDRPWKLRPQVRSLFLDTVPQQLADMESIMSRWSPDAITTDPAMWAPFLLISELHHMPVALLSYACGCMVPGPGAPPNGLGLPVPRHAWTRFTNKISGAAVDWFLSDMRRGAIAMRAQHGLPSFEGPVIGLAARVALYLVPSSPEFDYMRSDLPANVQYVGPLQWYPAPKPQPWMQGLRTDRPWVHITEGTFHVREPFLLRAAAQGLANLPMEVIMTTADARTADDLKIGKLADNIHVVDWVNHGDLLPKTSVMVTTAGGGTTMAGMGAGLPLVTVPTEWDKAENAQRVVEAGAGIRLSPKQCTPRKLRETVQKILDDPSYPANARRIAASLQRQGGPGRAALLLEAITGRKTNVCSNESDNAAARCA